MTTLPYEVPLTTPKSSRWNAILDKLQNALDNDVNIKGQSITAKNLGSVRIASEWTSSGDVSVGIPWKADGMVNAAANLGTQGGLVYISAGNWLRDIGEGTLNIGSNQCWMGPGYRRAAKIDLNGVNLNPFYFTNVN